MKIFGINISWRNKSIGDKIVVKTVKPSTTPISKIPSVKIGSLSYSQQFARGRGNFQAAEYDLSEIGKVEDVDSFLRQAFKKKEGLMFKEGIGVKGANKDTVRYYKTRMAQISQATNIPTITLIKRIARSLIRVSNAFLIKVRDESKSGGRTRRTASGKVLKPIAGYFPAAPETMRADLDPDNGKIYKWRQVLPDGRWRDYNPEDVVHFTIDKREGFLFGIPAVIPVIDDIRALRQIEENIELLLYQHLFPLFHYKVGTETAPAGYTEDGQKEVDLIQEQIRLMPSEGAIVTPERHEIKAVGSEGRAVRAEGYLNHFKKRVFTGLGVSGVDMGEGETSNRGTANVMSRALVDSIKAIQDDLEAMWDQWVVSELLLESSFGDDVLEEDNMVHLQFAEIDIQNKMEQEQHAAEMFKLNGLTYDEFRNELTREPIIIPDDPYDQDPKKYPEWHSTYWKLFEEPLNIIRAIDEPHTLQAQAALEMRSLAFTQKQQETAKKEKEKLVKTEANTISRDEVLIDLSSDFNTKIKDNCLLSAFEDLKSDTVSRLYNSINIKEKVDLEYLLSLGRMWANDTTEKFHNILVIELIRGFNDQTGFKAFNAEALIGIGRKTLYDRISYLFKRLAENAINLTFNQVDEQLCDVKLTKAQSDISEKLNIAFDAIKYRIDFIWNVETRKAYIFGHTLGMRYLNKYGFEFIAHPDGCERCRSLNGKIMIVNNTDINDIPPFHPNSRMKLRVVDNKFNMNTLETSEDKVFDQVDKDKLESCVLKVKKQLRKDHPNWNEKKIKSSAFAICTAQLKKD